MIILSVFTHVLIASTAASITAVLQSWATVLQTEYKYLIGRILDTDRVHMFTPSCCPTRQQKLSLSGAVCAANVAVQGKFMLAFSHLLIVNLAATITIVLPSFANALVINTQ